jgi:hypothetical protein
MTNDDPFDPDLIAKLRPPSAFSGQPLFVQAEDWQNNAMLGWTHFPMDLYAAGYKDAADGLLYALADQPSKNDHHHGLMPLWRELRSLLEQFDPPEADKELSAIEAFIRQLDEVDLGSYAFRYPTTKQGRPLSRKSS